MSNWREILAHQSKWTVKNSDSFRLSIVEANDLYLNADLHQLQQAAHNRRMALNCNKEVTYLIDRNINYTNICTINCQFCSFYRPPGHAETYTQSTAEISQRITELEEIGGSRILMQGGVNPNLPLSWYLDLISELNTRHPQIMLDCFSPIEIEGIAEVCNSTTLDVLTRMQKAGLDGLPGGGAEMLVDEIRNDVSPKKHGTDEWIRIMREAQSLGLTTSATNVFGFGESTLQRVEHLNELRKAQDEALEAGDLPFTSFIAWPVQLEVNTFGKRNRGRNRFELGAGPSEYLRHIAISRLFLDNFDHIQASWPTMGLNVAQMALLGGADDAGSTMMEENVVSASGTDKMEATELELQRIISRAGFSARRRDSKYNLLTTEILCSPREELAAPPPAQ
ncbi:MAG TPA: CofH family radical SAM protein [Candidatus Poseidoniales archaeon]|jgi:cyclic dehypoxanthinyl futalosine synthase|nr:MAG: dehypoxanthine futalosine cyclase [Euryarchaeota archaeon]HIG04036.1 CofH family radical SAM protein [Candidatus Poseidoniales archaeon]HIK78309.1 CofH family radical SAM protein [Candidatus Poseidoniales archaeon]